MIPTHAVFLSGNHLNGFFNIGEAVHAFLQISALEAFQGEIEKESFGLFRYRWALGGPQEQIQRLYDLLNVFFPYLL